MSKNSTNKTFSFLLTLLCIVSICFGQNKQLEIVNSFLVKGKSKQALQHLTTIETKKLSAEDLGYYYYLTAKSNYKENDDQKAIQNYLRAKKQYQKAKALTKAMEINLELASIIHFFKKESNKDKYYLDEYIKYALASRDNLKILKGYVQIASLKINEKEAKESLIYFRKSIQLNKIVKDKKLESKMYNNLSVLFSDVLSRPDSGLYYLRKDKILLEADKNANPNNICYNVMNQASNYSQLHQYDKAIALLLQADKMPLREHHKQVKENINTFLYRNYKDIENRDKALYHLEIAKAYHDSLNTEQQDIAVANFDIKYKTQEKELENLQLKTNATKNRAILFATLIALFIFIIISFLTYKNIVKKKRIAEQDKLIEVQKLEKVLKDQELNDIDIMLESQEKERQNIANELHDNLGSMLATLKLNFQNLKRQNEDQNQLDPNLSEQAKQNKLYDKTDALIDEAYQKVRNIAHLKNLGVIGSEGLLVAVNKMAEKMSIQDKLKINVIPFGLDERLDNTLEVTLFRMIQELCTNIIKHSEATEVNIYLTQGTPTEMNLIIEDNGKGFDPKTMISQAGIGLKNMEKKVEQMGGTFTIDSILSKGTSIIIDLPL